MSVEIERKYIIAIPDTDMLRELSCYTVSDITQTYLIGADGVSRRVRRRAYSDKTVYTETKKIRIDCMSANEYEREIDEAEYESLLSDKDPECSDVKKRRHTFVYHGKTFELDVYPEWRTTCIMETELTSRDEICEMPPFIKIIREVTGERAYSNHSMARRFPEEESYL